jgi:hypothetical protein
VCKTEKVIEKKGKKKEKKEGEMKGRRLLAGASAH